MDTEYMELVEWENYLNEYDKLTEDQFYEMQDIEKKPEVVKEKADKKVYGRVLDLG